MNIVEDYYTLDRFMAGELAPLSDKFGEMCSISLVHGWPAKLAAEISKLPGGQAYLTGGVVNVGDTCRFIFMHVLRELPIDTVIGNIDFYHGFRICDRPVSIESLKLFYRVDLLVHTEVARLAPVEYYESLNTPYAAAIAALIK